VSGFEVMAEQCSECLFGKTPVVSLARRRELIREMQRNDSHFVCHKATIARGHEGRGVCCRGDYDRNPARTNLMRVMGRLGAVRFVEEANL
jgi:hypothetical protein